MRLTGLLIAITLVLSAASPARADVTAFFGTTPTPANRLTKGFAIGAGILIVGFEFEYADTGDDVLEAAPSLKTGMGNVLLQTPFPVAGFQPYFTTGGGGYHEELAAVSETGFGLNTGGGVKISLAGPLRARVDYRLFRLHGDPLHETVHRLYAGVNLKF